MHPILVLLSYFDVFNHPLTKEELKSFLNLSDQETEAILATLIKKKQCFRNNAYISIQAEIEPLIKKREKKEKEAQLYFKKLPFYTKIIKCFPFVKGIGVSGSLSKGVMYKDGDIDYFIITSKNRLWICRTLLILFKKIILLNSRKYFCVNYFVDEDNLKILDQNIFTAIEVSHLLPVYNQALFNQLRSENNWTNKYLSNFQNPIHVNCYEGRGKLKIILEKLINHISIDRLDLFLMKLTYKRWSKKFKHFHPEKFELTMRSNRGVSKHHPRDFQNKVLTEYKKRLEKLNLQDESSILV